MDVSETSLRIRNPCCYCALNPFTLYHGPLFSRQKTGLMGCVMSLFIRSKFSHHFSDVGPLCLNRDILSVQSCGALVIDGLHCLPHPLGSFARR